MASIHFNTQNSHPLIPRDQTYVLDRKLVTIHSEDRDIKKYPNANKFEIHLPQVMENVSSMRLVECTFPSVYYTFSNEYQNTRLSFSVEPKDSSLPYFYELTNLSPKKRIMTIQIQEGFYCPHELAVEIQEKLNETVSLRIKQIIEQDTQQIVDVTYNAFRVTYDKVGQRFWFGNQTDGFTIYAAKEDYLPSKCEQPDMWEKVVNWGLAYNLGLNKEKYVSTPVLEDSYLKFSYLGSSGVWLTKQVDSSVNPQYVQAPNAPDLLGERVIYMEVDKYNSYDELVRGPLQSMSMYNNTYGGIVDSAFAKIPITATSLGEFTDSRNGFLQNVTTFDVPEEKVSKMMFVFRYHDGRLVDFGNNRFNFTIEFNCLKNEIGRSYSVRVPFAYTLKS